MWGLHISPDIDTVLYALSERLDVARGWGLQDETFRTLTAMAQLGHPAWFNLGDADLATHLIRTDMLRHGASMSVVVEKLASAMGIKSRILPATDDRVRTKIETQTGLLDFQEFFVRERCRPEVRSVIYSGAVDAQPTTVVVDAIREAQAIIVAPSNPITSIGPILAIPAIRDALRCARAEVVAVSPIIGHAAVSGPAGKLMEACGFEVSPEGVARCYHDFLDMIIVDTKDAGIAGSIRYDDAITVEVTDILIPDIDAAMRLAEFVIAKANENSSVAG
jgi:LPPG:FO 2-phospho-L-lactate transferase